MTSAEYFDQWYADMLVSSVKDEIEQQHLGLPPWLLSTSLLPWSGITDIVAALSLDPRETLLDLACGRGGYGFEVAARTGAKLIGIDYSAEAIRQAEAQRVELGRAGHFAVGDLTATGLATGTVDGAFCVDAIQFASPAAAAYDELCRVLRPGGRVAISCWEARSADDAQVPDRLRSVDLAAGLAGAGFVDVEVRERRDWQDVERAMWTEAAALDPGEDAALTSFHDEGVRSLGYMDDLRRVFAIATAPAG